MPSFIRSFKGALPEKIERIIVLPAIRKITENNALNGIANNDAINLPFVKTSER